LQIDSDDLRLTGEDRERYCAERPLFDGGLEPHAIRSLTASNGSVSAKIR